MTQITTTQPYLDNQLVGSPCIQPTHELNIIVQDSLALNLRESIKAYGWVKVFEFKKKILEHSKFKNRSISQLRLFHKNIQLKNDQRTLLDYNIGNGSTILINNGNKIQQGSKGVINPYKLFDERNQRVDNLINQAIKGVNSGQIPTLTSSGTSGAYTIKNTNNQIIGIFKPFDQEVHAPNNPRQRPDKLGSEGFFQGILSGQCATRQVAAYLLDYKGNNFHDVPVTTYAQFYHPTFIHKSVSQNNTTSPRQQKNLNNTATKHGSFQQFVSKSQPIQNYGQKSLSEKQIHKIGILDIRILNCDRNEQNILVVQQNGKNKLIPIDHGSSFPDNLQIDGDRMYWMGKSQSKKPFSAQELKFIQQIDPEKDAQMLSSKLGFRQICLRNFRIAEIFLKKAASLNFTLYQMGKMLYRKYDDQNQNIKSKRSKIETLVMQAETLYINAKQIIQKQNIDPQINIQNFDDQQNDQFHLQEIEQEEQKSESNGSTSTSTKTCQSVKSITQFLALKKKNSLPQLQKKDTMYHENRQKARKQREGINGIGKTIWNKYHQQEWDELFYYYFENLLDTLLHERSMEKQRKLSAKSQSYK